MKDTVKNSNETILDHREVNRIKGQKWTCTDENSSVWKKYHTTISLL